MIKWVLVFLVFGGPKSEQLIGNEMFMGESEQECRDAKKEALSANKPGDRVIFWADCFPVDYVPPKPDTKADPASEVRS